MNRENQIMMNHLQTYIDNLQLDLMTPKQIFKQLKVLEELWVYK